MFSIYICEDDEKQLADLKKAIENHLSMLDSDISLTCATTLPSELLGAIKSSNATGLYFLDIELGADLNGLDLAKEIRRCDPRAYIVFITAHNDMSGLTYEYQVEAMDFISKDNQKKMIERVCKCIATASENYKSLLIRNHSALLVKIEKANIVIDQKDILLIESSTLAHRIIVHQTTGILRVSGSLKEYETTLNKDFFRCSQSAIVNLAHVDEYQPKDGKIIMDNRKAVFVSQRSKANFKKALHDYQLNSIK